MPLLHFFSGIKKNIGRYKTARGFSLLELLVVLSIAIIITTVVLLDYPLFGANQALNISVQETAQAIREAQLYGISVKQSTDCPSGPSSCKYPAYGLYFEGSGNPIDDYSEKIIVFADTNNDGTYDSSDKIDNTYTISPPNYIHAICYSTDEGDNWKSGDGVGCGAPGAAVTKATVLFKRPNPEPNIKITTTSVSTPFEVSAIKINIQGPSSPDGQDVFISKYGQVSIGGFNKKISAPATCPYIFSWNGSEYVYEHRGLALSGIGKKQTNIRMLHSLAPVDGKLTLKVFEDYDETHLDALEIRAIDIPSSSSAVVYPDTLGRFRTFKNEFAPLSCESAGINCLEDVVRSEDQKELYFGAIAEGEENSPKSSEVILNFSVPSGTKEAKLFLKLKMDNSLYKIFPNLYKDVGPFVFEVMANKSLRKIFNIDETINKLALNVDVWENGKWKEVAGEVPSDLKTPEELLFSIQNIPALEKNLRIRLRSLFRYHLDYVSLDTSADEPMKITKAPLEKAAYEGVKEGEALVDSIAFLGDNKEAIISAGNSIKTEFVDPDKEKETKRFYASSFSGFYFQKKPNTVNYSFSPSAILNAYKFLNKGEGAPQYLFEKYAK